MKPPGETALAMMFTAVPAWTLLPFGGFAIRTSGGTPIGATVLMRRIAVVVPTGETRLSLLSNARASITCAVGVVLVGV